jgi:hypothetical protein
VVAQRVGRAFVLDDGLHEPFERRVAKALGGVWIEHDEPIVRVFRAVGVAVAFDEIPLKLLVEPPRQGDVRCVVAGVEVAIRVRVPLMPPRAPRMHAGRAHQSRKFEIGLASVAV